MTYYPSKVRLFLRLAGSLVLMTAGIVALTHSPWNWLAVLLFSTCSLIYGLALLPQATYLRLEKDGFILVTAFRPSTYKWGEVDAFRVGKIGTIAVVCFDYQNPQAQGSVFSIQESNLPVVIGFSPDELVRLLNDGKSKFTQMS